MTRTAPDPRSPGAPADTDTIRVAVSTVIFTLRRLPGSDAVQIVLPLVRRTRDPHEGQWALPGGWLDATEGLDAAASRTLAETTGLAPSYLEQLYAFGAVDRSPTRVVSIVYWALLRADEFTLADLREVYEAVLGRRLDPANFRRQVENSGTLIPTDRFRTGSHRPARLYRYNQDVELADRGPLSARH